MQIVHFLDIDTKKITFGKPKQNKHNGSQIGILYNGKSMYVKYEGETPFGLEENFHKDGNYQGTSMQINCQGQYRRKAKELDQFFINVFYENKWGLAHNVPKSSIEGYDEHGQGGLWKRSCKDPYRLNGDFFFFTFSYLLNIFLSSIIDNVVIIYIYIYIFFFFFFFIYKKFIIVEQSLKSFKRKIPITSPGPTFEIQRRENISIIHQRWNLRYFIKR